ncbi:histone H1.2-like [Raphanus sativus]|uniref:Histone H1.2-like n=1 Tax=Raphanus sativus TaxID=3726 RepID=A0A9W3C5I7_RAPSA|nr:histone H1.2-like [Raphanus sativus]
MTSPAVDQENIPLPVDGINTTVTTEPAVKGGKTTKKAKKAKPKKMIKDAIVLLKERTGSSQYAIQKFIEEKHKVFSPSLCLSLSFSPF